MQFDAITTDNICLVAILTLDVRPSSVCCYPVEGRTNCFDLQILKHETIGRPFDWKAKRFGKILKEAFGNTEIAEVAINLMVVDELKYKFEDQKACQMVTKPIVVGA